MKPKFENPKWMRLIIGLYLCLSVLAFQDGCGLNHSVTPPGQTPDSPLASVARMNDVLSTSTHTATTTVKALATAGKITNDDAAAVLTVLGNIDAAGLQATGVIDSAATLDGTTAQKLAAIFSNVSQIAITLTTNGNLFVKNPTHKAEVVAAINLVAASASAIAQGITAMQRQ